MAVIQLSQVVLQAIVLARFLGILSMFKQRVSLLSHYQAISVRKCREIVLNAPV